MKMRIYYVAKDHRYYLDYIYGPCKFDEAYDFMKNADYDYKLKIVYREIEVED